MLHLLALLVLDRCRFACGFPLLSGASRIGRCAGATSCSLGLLGGGHWVQASYVHGDGVTRVLLDRDRKVAISQMLRLNVGLLKVSNGETAINSSLRCLV